MTGLRLPGLIIVASLACFSGAQTQEAFPFRNQNLSVEVRADDLVARLSLEEKTKQMLFNAPAIERLGVPAYNWWNEALHGVARNGKATVFPMPIGLAATFDEGLLFRVGSAVSDEGRAKYNDNLRKRRHGIYEGITFWAPNINIFRDPRWGRGMETYGEDPYLTGRTAASFIRGMQGDDPRYLKTVATPKHFAVHSGPEPDRHTFNAIVDERDLRETYLPQFRTAVIEGHAQSVMCAYNRFRGYPCCGSNELLHKILRDEWGFEGYVVSDCWAIMDIYNMQHLARSVPEPAAMALKAGTDLNCGVAYDSLEAAVNLGLVAPELVDQSVKRLFRARISLGMFDVPDSVPYSHIPMEVVDGNEHRALALEAARKSIVLLKNEKHILPVSKKTKTIAVIGPNADEAELLLGNYNGIPTEIVTPLEGIRRKAGAGTNIIFARGCDVADSVPALRTIGGEFLTTIGGGKGLKGEYFSNNRLVGTASLSRIDTAVDFNWWDKPAAREVLVDTFSVRWTGLLTPALSGEYAVGVSGFGGCQLYLDDSLIVQSSSDHATSTEWKTVRMDSGKGKRIRLEYRHIRPDARVRLFWSPPEPGLLDEAFAAARAADVVVACMGLSPRLEGEALRVSVPGFFGGDRVDIGLPSTQEALLKKIASAGKPVVLVLLNGSSLAIPWAKEHIPGIIEAWYPGQSSGDALADVLFGDENPSGRLPVTMYRSESDLPPFSDYRMAGRTYRYFTGAPLYTFGFGLSYTTFAYSNLRLPQNMQTGETLHVAVDLENTGDRSGDEVAQLYVSRTPATSAYPLKALAGFRRVSLRPGEKKRIDFTLPPRSLSHIDGAGKCVIEPGEIRISVGGRAPDPDLPAGEISAGRVRLSGNRVELSDRK